MKARAVVVAACAALALAVGLGAFGAHALRGRLSPEAMSIYQTAVQYHFWHGLGLLGVGALCAQWPGSRGLTWAAGFLLAGLVLFCGSLYLLALSGQRWLGAVAPIGGGAFIAAWVLVACTAWRKS